MEFKIWGFVFHVGIKREDVQDLEVNVEVDKIPSYTKGNNRRVGVKITVPEWKLDLFLRVWRVPEEWGNEDQGNRISHLWHKNLQFDAGSLIESFDDTTWEFIERELQKRKHNVS